MKPKSGSCLLAAAATSFPSRAIVHAVFALGAGCVHATTVTTSWEYYTATGSSDQSWVAPASTTSVLAIDWGTGGSGTATTWGGIDWVGSNAGASYNASGAVQTWYSHPNVAWGSSYGDNTFYPSSGFPLLGSGVVGGDNHILEIRGLNSGQQYKIQFVVADSRSMGAPDDDRSITLSGSNGTTGAASNYRYGYADGQYAVITANVIASAGGYAVFKPSCFNDNGSIGQQINAMQVLAVNQPSLSWTAGAGSWSATDLNWTGGVAWTDPTADAIFDNASSTTAITIDGSQTAATVTVGNGTNNGSYTFNGGTLNAAAFLIQGNGSNDPGIGATTINNLNLNTAGDLGVGRWDLVVGGTSTLNIGGELRSTSDGSGAGDWGRVTIQDNANVTATGGVNGAGSAWGLTLNGGILTTPSIRANEVNYAAGSRLTFNGTTVVPSQDHGNFVVVDGSNRAFIGGNGAVFDTNGRNITIGVTLNDSESQSGSLTKTGAGTLTLGGVSNYSGGTFVNQGTLSLAGGGGWGRIGGRLTVNNGGTVLTTGDGTGLGFNNQLGRLTINHGGLVTSNGASHIWNIGEGVHLAGGTLQSNAGVSDPNGAQLEWGSTTVFSAGDNTSTIAGRIRIRADNSPTLVFDVANGAQATDLLVSAAVTESGPSGIVKTGAGTMALTGVNSYTGSTTVEEGTLSLGDGSNHTNLADAAAVSIAFGAKVNLNFNGDDTIGRLIIDGTTVDGGIYNSDHPVYGEYFSGAGSLVVLSQDGTWISTVDGNWGNSSNWQGGAVASGYGKTATFSAGTGGESIAVTLDSPRTIGNLAFSNANYTISGANTLGLESSVVPTISVAAGHSATLSASATSTGLEKLGPGTLVLNGSSSKSFGGTNVVGGTLAIDVAAALGGLTIQNGAQVLANGAWNFGNSGLVIVENGGLLTATFVANGINSGLILSGGTVAGGGSNSDWGVYTLNSDVIAEGGVTSTISAEIGLAGVTRIFNVTADSTLNVSGVIHNSWQYGPVASGNFGTPTVLTKTGAGTMVLSANNGYSGHTTVQEGTLVLGNGTANSNLADTADVSVSMGAVLHLNFAPENADTIDELWLGGAPMSPGTYHAGNSNGLITGTGSLIVQNGPISDPFAAWMDSYYPGVTDPLVIGEAADPDNDSIANLVEYVLLGGDPSVSNPGILPTLGASGADFVFSFTRVAASATDTTQVFQYGGNLSGWEDVPIAAGDYAGGVNVAITPVGDNDQVVITVPKGTATELFGRLKVSKP